MQYRLQECPRNLVRPHSPGGGFVVVLQHLHVFARLVPDELKVLPADGGHLPGVAERVAHALESGQENGGNS